MVEGLPTKASPTRKDTAFWIQLQGWNTVLLGWCAGASADVAQQDMAGETGIDPIALF